MSTTTVAIIGTGNIAGGRHLPSLRELGERVHVAAAVDVDEARVRAFCDAHQIPAGYTGTSEMLDAVRPDLVIIATPPALHVDQAIEAMRAGAWVVCEKPLSGSLADLDRLVAAQEEFGVHCCSVLQWRFGPMAQRLKSLIEQGALGRPLLGISLTTWFRPAAYYEVAWRGTWRDELGGVTLSQGVHALDLLLWLMGPWEEVRGVAETVVHDVEIEDVSSAVVRFAGGAVGNIVTSVVSPREESYLRLDFERATVELRHLYHYGNADWSLTPAPGHEGVADLLADAESDSGSLHGNQFRAVLDARDAGVVPPASVVDARNSLDFIASLYQAARTGTGVRAGSISDSDDLFTSLGQMRSA